MKSNVKKIIVATPLLVALGGGLTASALTNDAGAAEQAGVAIKATSDKDCGGAKTVKPNSTNSKIPGLENNATVNKIIKNPKTKWVTNVDCEKIKGAKAASNNPKYKGSTNWSGQVVTDPSLKTINYVESSWIEPSYRAKLNTTNGVWVGMGGALGTSGNLVQDGTYALTFDNGIQSHGLFYEVYPINNVTAIKNIRVKAGDKIYVSSAWSTNKVATFVMCNQTINTCTTMTMENIEAPGASAEWITERISNPNTTDNLADYGKVTFTGNNWQKDESGNIVHKTISPYATPYAMTSTDGLRGISNPGPINKTDESFSTYWKAFK